MLLRRHCSTTGKPCRFHHSFRVITPSTDALDMIAARFNVDSVGRFLGRRVRFAGDVVGGKLLDRLDEVVDTEIILFPV